MPPRSSLAAVDRSEHLKLSKDWAKEFIKEAFEEPDYEDYAFTPSQTRKAIQQVLIKYGCFDASMVDQTYAQIKHKDQQNGSVPVPILRKVLYIKAKQLQPSSMFIPSTDPSNDKP